MRWSLLAVLSCASLAGRPAHADTASEQAMAFALFNEGKALAAAGDYTRACAKFEAADRLTGWLGVELNLADCYTHVGRTASAWVLWRKAADKAEAQRDERATYARTRAEELEPSLARLSVIATGSVEIQVDKVVIGAADLDVALPVDPGEHEVTARDRVHGRTWSRRVVVSPRSSVVVRIPALGITQPPPAQAPRARWLPWTLGGTTIALLGATAWLGVSAKLAYDDALAGHCDVMRRCDPAGVEQIASARRRGNVATVLGALGVGTAAGTVILLLARRHDQTGRDGWTVAPVVSETSVGVAIGASL